MCPIRPNGNNRTIATDPATTAEDDDPLTAEPEMRAVGSEEEDPHHNTNTMLEDPWSTTSAGYTPLSDLDLSETTSSTNNNTYTMLATGRIPDQNDDDAEVDEDVGAAPAAADANINFEALAAVALSALETEYQQTTSQLNTSGINHENSVERNEEEEEQEAERTLNIAAAFDRGLEERKQATAGTRMEFHVDWDELVKKEEAVNTSTTTTVDTEAVRKVVQTLSLTNTDKTAATNFQQKFAAWEYTQQQQRRKVKYHHRLIPTASVKAFRKTTPTPKSKLATHQLSRSATLADAMVRCSLLSSSVSLAVSSSTLVLDIVGVDQIECKNITTIQTTFRPFCTWLDRYYGLLRTTQQQPEPSQNTATEKTGCAKVPSSCCRVHFRLIGRDLLVSEKNNSLVVFQSPSMLATATCHAGVYHEFREEEKGDEDDHRYQQRRPDLIVAYNAGIWGYTEWKATIQYLASASSRSQPQQHHATSATTVTAAAAVGDPATTVTTGSSRSNNSSRSTIMIITAYTFEECEGDHEQITEAINTTTTKTTTTTKQSAEAGERDDNVATSSTTPAASTAQLLWGPEVNPYGSQVQRRTIGRTNIQNAHKYYDNAAWQAWTFGGE